MLGDSRVPVAAVVATLILTAAVTVAQGVRDSATAAAGDVRITELSCDSSPEYVRIRNFGVSGQPLIGLHIQSDPGQDYDLFNYTGSILPGETLEFQSGLDAANGEDTYKLTSDELFRDGDPGDYARLLRPDNSADQVQCGSVPITPTPGTPTATPMYTPPPGTPGPTPPPPTGTPISPTRFDDPVPDGCQPNDCSLREAIIAANDSPGTDTIALGTGQYDLSFPSTGPKVAGPSISSQNLVYTTPLSIADDTIVVGMGADRTRLNGEGVGGILSIQHSTFAAISVQISNLAIQDGVRDGGGGGIYAASGVSLSINRVSMTGNGGGGGAGGAIRSYGPTTIADSTIADNWAQDGGAIYGGSPLIVTNSTISRNVGISGNGGISSAHASLTNVTITGNTSGGLRGFLGMTVRNSIIAGNTGSQCSGVASLGHNLSSDDSCGLGPGDLPSTDPLLGPLADNGGPTQTHALLPGSPAADGGDDAACPTSDQRGRPRSAGAHCDIGAFEFSVAVQGDVSCDEQVTAVDSLFLLREVAGLGAGTCAMNGDVNCDGVRNAVDALGVLRFVAGLPVNQHQPCAEVGTAV